MQSPGFVVTIVAAVVVAACSQPRVHSVQSYAGPPMQRPDSVLVYDFAVSPEEVQLDQGISARVTRAVEDKSLSQQEWDAAQQARAVLAEALVRRLRSYGLPAQLATAGATGHGSSLLIHGQIVSVDEGNRTRRVLIGLGAGRSSVSADAQLFYEAVGTSAPIYISTLEGSSESGRTPGMGETLGVGAAAHRPGASAALGAALHAISESRAAGGDNVERLAESLAKQIGMFAAGQGWIPASAVR